MKELKLAENFEEAIMLPKQLPGPQQTVHHQLFPRHRLGQQVHQDCIPHQTQYSMPATYQRTKLSRKLSKLILMATQQWQQQKEKKTKIKYTQLRAYLNNICHANKDPYAPTNKGSNLCTKVIDMNTQPCITVPNPNCSISTA